ncbi:hypothetical protein AB0J43_02625 [Nonomuraea fuscirosea]
MSDASATPLDPGPILPGSYVRSLTWETEFVGTVTAVDEDGDLYITWHDTICRDQKRPDQVAKLTEEEKAAYIAAWKPEAAT